MCSNLCTQKWMLILRRWPDRVFAWRYTHLLLFAATPAVGVGLRVAAEALEGSGLTLMQITLSLAIPVVCVLVLIFVLWSVLMRAYDLTHVPLLLVSLIPVAAAVFFAAVSGGTATFDAESESDVTALVVVIALIACSAIIEVIGHEIVGYPHTLRVINTRLAAHTTAQD